MSAVNDVTRDPPAAASPPAAINAPLPAAGRPNWQAADASRSSKAAASAASHGLSREVLTFKLGPESYALDILRVQEIRGYEEPMRIAGAPGHIKGVVNLRGVIVPIVDMRLRFGLYDAGFDATTVTIVLNIGQRVIGAVVDQVSDVIEIPLAAIQPAPEFSGAVDAQHITGIATLGEGEARRMLILLDVETLLGSEGLL